MGVETGLRDAQFIASDNRSNFKDVIAKRSDLVITDGGRLGPSQFGVSLQAGTVLGLATSGGDSGYWKPYLVGSSDGSQVAKGVLRAEAYPDASGNGSEIAIIKDGILFKDLLIGLDAGAITNMNAGVTVEHGTNLIHVRA